MSPLRLTARRTIGCARSAFATAFVAGVFLSAAQLLFAFNLDAAEGGRLSVAVVWARSVAPLLPVLAALFGMGVWSDERQSGRLDVMLASPVSEFEFTLGKFVGTWVLTLFAAALSLGATVATLGFHASECPLPVWGFVAAFAVLALQAALWCAVAVAASAAFSLPAVAACVAVFLTAVLPRALWAALMAWSPQGRPAYGEMPLDAHVTDLASGLVPVGTVAGYAILAAFALTLAVAFVEFRRLVGRGARRRRMTLVASVVLSGVLAFLTIALFLRLGLSLDVPLNGAPQFSERTVGILSETRGEISVTCFTSRSDGSFRALARLLRAMARKSASLGGARMSVRVVDPAWDVGEASRLVQSGVRPGRIRFAYGRRVAELPVAEGCDERAVASTVLRLTMPPQRRNVRWTQGHGEASFADYETFGMSDAARELARDGYVNQTIDLAADAQIPSDCALIIVAGAREDFSRVECARLDAYLRQGGRLLVLVHPSGTGGLSPLLASWGVSAMAMSGTSRTVSGSDVVVSDFADHPICSSLRGVNLVLERPVAFGPSAAAEVAASVDRIGFTALAKSGANCVAALIERGARTGEDLDFRPTRLVVVGDAAFVMNGALAGQANANREFFLNAVSYLSGTDAMTPGGAGTDRLVTGMDRTGRRKFVFVGACAIPLAVAFALWVLAFCRRVRR